MAKWRFLKQPLIDCPEKSWQGKQVDIFLFDAIVREDLTGDANKLNMLNALCLKKNVYLCRLKKIASRADGCVLRWESCPVARLETAQSSNH